MGCTRPSGFNVLYLFGNNNPNKGLEVAMAVPVGSWEQMGASHAPCRHNPGPGVLFLSPSPALPYPSPKQLPQWPAYLAARSGSPWTWGSHTENHHQGDLKSRYMWPLGIGIESKASHLLGTHCTTVHHPHPGFSHFVLFPNLTFYVCLF